MKMRTKLLLMILPLLTVSSCNLPLPASFLTTPAAGITRAHPSPAAAEKSPTPGAVLNQTAAATIKPAATNTLEQPSAAPTQQATPSPLSAPCIWGRWQIQPGEMEAYLNAVFRENAPSGWSVEIQELGGTFRLDFRPDGILSGSSRDYRVRATIANLLQTEIEIKLAGEADYTTAGSTLIVSDPDYFGEGIAGDLVPSILSGEEAVITISPGLLAYQSSQTGGTMEIEDQGSGEYLCSGDSLSFDLTGYGTLNWTRAAP
jgi:hypothetical protein